MAAIIGAASIVGVQGGILAARGLPGAVIRRLFGILLLITAVQLVLRPDGRRRTPWQNDDGAQPPRTAARALDRCRSRGLGWAAREQAARPSGPPPRLRRGRSGSRFPARRRSERRSCRTRAPRAAGRSPTRLTGRWSRPRPRPPRRRRRRSALPSPRPRATSPASRSSVVRSRPTAVTARASAGTGFSGAGGNQLGSTVTNLVALGQPGDRHDHAVGRLGDSRARHGRPSTAPPRRDEGLSGPGRRARRPAHRGHDGLPAGTEIQLASPRRPSRRPPPAPKVTTTTTTSTTTTLRPGPQARSRRRDRRTV